MKWSIAGLMLLGIGAAVAASVLVASLKSGGPTVTSAVLTPGEAQILVAAKPMPAMSVVEANSVMLKSVPANEAPEHSMRQPTDVIGKLLIVPVVEGQVLTTTCFADEKSGARLASTLADGMRAVSLSLAPDKAGLLYAGCVVDVIVSLNRPSTEGSGIKEAMSMTLLQGIGVLAIDDTSVMSDAPTSGTSASETANSNRRMRRDRLVTLKVNPVQARALQLAGEFGDVSLALRNPLDVNPVKTDSTMLSDLADEYTRLLAAIAPLQATEPKADVHGQPSNPPQVGQNTRMDLPGPDRAAMINANERREQFADERTPLPERMLIGQKLVDPKSEIMVIRGAETEICVFRPNEEWWVLDSRTRSGINANTK